MKALLRITLLIAAIVSAGVTVAQAQRVLTGTVYMDGEPAAGVTVEVHKGGTMTTSFDGKYEVAVDPKSKWIKFTPLATGESVREDIENIQGDVFDIAVTGELPSASGAADVGAGGVNLKSLEDLIKEQNQDFMNEWSLYTEFYKQGDYKSAMPHWKKLLKTYPKSTTNLYIQGAKMYEDMIEKAPTAEARKKLLDEYMKLHDTRIKYFGQEGFVLGRKGTAWLKYKLNADDDETPDTEELKKIHKTGFELLSKSVEMQGNETEPPVLVLLMQTTVALFKLGDLPKEKVVENYEKCTEIANNIVATSDDEKEVQITQEQVLPFIEDLFGKSGAADCDVLIKIYSSEYEENKDDIDYIKSMLRRLGKANCTESELFGTATERLYQLDPSAEAAFNMARRFLKKDDMEKAREYYQMAIDQETDNTLKATYHYERGLLRYIKDGNLVGARNDARLALELDPDLCEANKLIGDIYVAASQKFEGTALEKSAVFWLACDYYAKARRGEDCAIEASEMLAKYKKYFPNKEEAFMEGLQDGATYHVGGWINENTKVRF
ncbi:tetratricopeptide repeat protein [Maribellus sediminis]|uniref:tetratricopeptide repeat protein n=1 Tax=Maribellus sediminis TaxID=2696285 RepID=UPI0014307755|nr:tetratricopeptide repeat protein [Maribellus sediminis]